MEVVIRRIGSIEDKDIYILDCDEFDVSEMELIENPKVHALVFDKYYYFTRGEDPSFPASWTLFVSNI